MSREYYVDINVVAENLAELLTNSTNMASVFYDIFLNPIPMDVVLKQYNDENELVEVTIPNRAKDRRIAITGTGSPEGVVEAPPGVCYINEAGDGEGSGPIVYFKVEGTGTEGWTEVLTESALEGLVARLRPTIATSGSNVVLLDNEGNVTSSADISDICANKSLSNLNATGNAVIASKASVDLDNLSNAGKARIAIKEYLPLETYNTNDIVMSIIDDRMALFRSVVDDNTGNDVTDTSKWERVPLGGSSRCIGEVVTSTIPIVDAGVYPANGDTVYGSGMYSEFVEFMKKKYYGSVLYAFEYTIGSETHRVYIKDRKIVDGEDPEDYPEGSFDTTLYNVDGTEYEGADFVVSLEDGVYWVYYVGAGQRPPQGACTYNSEHNVYNNVKSDVQLMGGTLDEDGVLSGFTTSNYARITVPFTFGNEPWQMFYKVKTGANVQTKQFLNSNWNEQNYVGPAEIFMGSGKFGITLSSDGTSTGKIGNDNTGTYTVQPNTTYFLLLEFTGEEYHLKYSLTGFNDNMITDISVVSSVTVANQLQPIIGVDYGDVDGQGFPHIGAPWLGTIDLNECRVLRNGVPLWYGRMPSGFVTEYQHIYEINTYDTCAKYAFNETNNSIRIPKLYGYIEGTTDIAQLGNHLDAAIPNITGKVGGISKSESTFEGAFYKSGTTETGDADSGTDWVAAFDASRCSSVYSDTAQTVQTDAVMLLYYIVISTSTKIAVESNIDQIAYDLARKVNKSSLSRIYPIVEVYENNNAWYRVYADGWCEQGNAEAYGTSSTASERTRTLLKPYRDENYSVFLTPFASNGNIQSGYFTVKSKTTMTFTTHYNINCSWFACGYLW